jgi:hypothetical protein
MRELSKKEWQVQSAVGTLSKYRVTIEKLNGNSRTMLCSIPIEAANQVDALHKAWKKKRK